MWIMWPHPCPMVLPSYAVFLRPTPRRLLRPNAKAQLPGAPASTLNLEKPEWRPRSASAVGCAGITDGRDSDTAYLLFVLFALAASFSRTSFTLNATILRIKLN